MAVAWGATGAGGSTTTASSGTITTSWSHTKAAADNYVIVSIGVQTTGGGTYTGYTRTPTYGGVTMTSVVALDKGGAGSTNGWTELFYLANPPSGAQTVSVSVFKTSATYTILRGSSVSYSGVGSLGTPVTFGASSTSAQSGTVTSKTGDMVANAMCGNLSGSITNYSTQRYNAGTGVQQPIVQGDKAGAASVSFTATLSSSQAYSSVSVNLLAAPPTPTNLFFSMF